MLATLTAIPTLALGTSVSTLEIILVVIFGLGFIGFGVYGSLPGVISKYKNRPLQMEDEDEPVRRRPKPSASTSESPSAAR